MTIKLFKLAESHGIKIEYWHFSQPIQAVFIEEPGLPPIVGINKTLLKKKADFRCVLAEELGHYFTSVGRSDTHKHIRYHERLKIIRTEYRALKWAALFLIPTEELSNAIENGYTSIWDLAHHFNVTADMIKFRLSLQDCSKFISSKACYKY